MSSSREAADQRKRHRKSTHKEKKKRKSRASPDVDVVEGDGEVIKLKVEHSLLQELQLATSISTFPKPLREFIEDRNKLLDEVFTVLSRHDVEGMLPDILKGLKMKRIKELCGEQLARLDNDSVMSILSGQEDSMPPTACPVEQPPPLHGTPPVDDRQDASTPFSPSLLQAEFSDVSDQEQQLESSSTDCKVAAASSDRVRRGGERCAWTDAREEGDKGDGESAKSKEATSQWTTEDPAPRGEDCAVESDEDGLDISTAITDTIDMELAGDVPKHEPDKQLPQVSKTSQSAHKTQQHKLKKHKSRRRAVTRSTSISKQTDCSTLENKLRKKLLSRVQQQAACRVSDEANKEVETPTLSVTTPVAKSSAAGVDSRELELRMKEKVLKSLLTKSLRKRVP